MKKAAAFLLLLILSILLTGTTAAKETVWQQNQSIAFSGGQRTVTAIYADLNDRGLRMESVLAKNQVGKADDLKTIAQSAETPDQKVLGAINGTFFNAYSDLQPASPIETKGQFVHMGNTGSEIGFTGDNTVVMDHLYISIKGFINGSSDYPNNWSAYKINHVDTDSDTLFTPAFGKTTGKQNKYSVVVERGKAVKILQGEAPIPANGFTLAFGSTSHYEKHFSVGDTVSYQLQFNTSIGGQKGGTLSWENIRTTVGAGPMLLKNGNIVVDAKKEGFTEDKITTNRGQRSFAAVTKGNVLILGTVPNVNVKELAEIVKKLGGYNAMCLDGGASSGLYYNGRYLTTPGRKLSNALVITRQSKVPVRLILNGQELYYDTDPYLSGSSLVMVPLKGIFQSFGAYMDTDGLTFQRAGITYRFQPGSSTALVDGSRKEMGAALESKNGKYYVPLNFVAEEFGAALNWDSSRNIAVLSSDTATAAQVYQKALDAAQSGDASGAESLYLKTLELDPGHSAAMLKLARLYSDRKDYNKAIQYYNQYLALKPDDADVRSSLGWAAIGGYQYDLAESAFQYLIQAHPSTPSYWRCLGTVYSSYKVKRYAEARQCFQKALELNPSDKEKTAIQQLLDSIRDK